MCELVAYSPKNSVLDRFAATFVPLFDFFSFWVTSIQYHRLLPLISSKVLKRRFSLIVPSIRWLMLNFTVSISGFEFPVVMLPWQGLRSFLNSFSLILLKDFVLFFDSELFVLYLFSAGWGNLASKFLWWINAEFLVNFPLERELFSLSLFQIFCNKGIVLADTIAWDVASFDSIFWRNKAYLFWHLC